MSAVWMTMLTISAIINLVLTLGLVTVLLLHLFRHRGRFRSVAKRSLKDFLQSEEALELFDESYLRLETAKELNKKIKEAQRQQQTILDEQVRILHRIAAVEGGQSPAPRMNDGTQGQTTGFEPKTTQVGGFGPTRSGPPPLPSPDQVQRRETVRSTPPPPRPGSAPAPVDYPGNRTKTEAYTPGLEAGMRAKSGGGDDDEATTTALPARHISSKPPPPKVNSRIGGPPAFGGTSQPPPTQGALPHPKAPLPPVPQPPAPQNPEIPPDAPPGWGQESGGGWTPES